MDTSLEVSLIHEIKIPLNVILIKPGPLNDYIILGEDKVRFDTSFEPEKHTNTWGEVVVVPNALSPEIETEIEIQKGDTIFFHYLCMMNAIQDKKYLIYNDQMYFMVNYDSCFCVRRKLKDVVSGADWIRIWETTGNAIMQNPTPELVVMLNGYILVEPLDVSLPDVLPSGIKIPREVARKNHANEGTVRYVGKPLKGQKPLVEVGDRVVFRTHSTVPLQYDLHANFEGKQTYYRMKNDNILAVKTCK